jgi:transposase-like protein
MPRGKKFTAEQIIGKLREAEVGLAQGKTVPEVVRKLGVTEQTYERWKREYGGLRTDQAKRLKDLEKENARLRGPCVRDRGVEPATIVLARLAGTTGTGCGPSR